MEPSSETGAIILISIVFLVPTGYLLAWRSKSEKMRGVGAIVVAVYAGLAGLLCSWIALGMTFDWPGTPLTERLVAAVIPASFAIGTFYLMALFISRARKANQAATKPDVLK